jgi:hypothetical protein
MNQALYAHMNNKRKRKKNTSALGQSSVDASQLNDTTNKSY